MYGGGMMGAGDDDFGGGFVLPSRPVGCDAEMVRDGICQVQCYNEENDFDGGDCCISNVTKQVTLPEKDTLVGDSVSIMAFAKPGEEIERYLADKSDTRFRSVGDSNFLVAGFLINQERAEWGPCGDRNFDGIYPECADMSKENTNSYGSDPVFVTSSALYHQKSGKKYRDATCLGQSFCLTSEAINFKHKYYDVNDSKIVDKEADDRPFGFQHLENKGLDFSGFPIYFDVNLNQERAKRWTNYINDGFYVDSLTKTVSVTGLCYNGRLGLFALVETTFNFNEAGMISVDNFLQTFKVNMYANDVDSFRMVLEILFTFLVAYYLCGELHEWWSIGTRKYFVSIWNYFDLANLFLQTSLIVGYISYYTTMASTFQPQSRYEVYQDLETPARFLRLRDDSDMEFNKALTMFKDAKDIATWNSWFCSTSTISLVLMTFRMLKALNFQPRLGLVTKTIERAAPDLANFSILFFLVSTGFAAIAYLNFGSSCKGFSALPTAFDSLFRAVVFGDTAQYDELQATSNAGSGTLFFWVYILVVMFILFNILLAILIDSYADVNDELKESNAPGMPQEVSTMWNAMMRARGKMSDAKLLGQLESLAEKVEEDGEVAEDAQERTLKLADFQVNQKGINDVVTRVSDKVSESEEASTRELLLMVLERFGEGGPSDVKGPAKVLPTSN